MSEEYISCAGVYQDRADQKTLSKFMDKYLRMYKRYPKTIVADAGYGSYDNYMYCLDKKIEAYIKYTMYSKEKEKKYQKRIYDKRNWKKTEDGEYICPAGNVFHCIKESEEKRSTYYRINQQHSCEKCGECEQKKQCTKAKGDRIITVNPILDELEAEAKKKLDSEKGIRLRIQRSIQSEGAFGVIKADHEYERFHRRNLKNVEMEFQMVCIGYNLMKYHNKKMRKKLKA